MRTVLLILLAFAMADSFAAELLPQRLHGHLGARIQGSALPEGFRRDLVSGLTNRLMIRVTLHDPARELHGRAVEIAIRYDLWDELFTVTTRVDGVAADTAVLQEVEQVMHRLHDIRLPELFAIDGVPQGTDLVMEAVVLLNPIDRERMEAIRKWVAQNSSRSSLDPAAAMGAGDVSLPNAIFNRIFEQYASGADVAAAWQQTSRSKPFRPERLPDASTHESAGESRP